MEGAGTGAAAGVVPAGASGTDGRPPAGGTGAVGSTAMTGGMPSGGVFVGLRFGKGSTGPLPGGSGG